VVCVILIAAVALAWRTAWLRQSPERIRASLLNDTPIGTGMDDVRGHLERQGREYRPGVRDGGWFEVYLREAGPGAATAIEADLGEYQGLPWW
jgi:hypothetical protein